MTSLKIARYLLVITLMVFPLTLTSNSNANANTEDAKSFIRTVSERALATIADKSISDKEKEAALVKLFEDSVDTAWIAQFAMGMYWNHATDLQRKQYTELHHKFLINSYVPKFKQYTNQKIALKKSLDEGDREYLIETEILQEGAPSINVDYKVRQDANGNCKIFDVIAEGVSLITTQRSEFSSILSRKGVDYLIKQLKAKV